MVNVYSYVWSTQTKALWSPQWFLRMRPQHLKTTELQLDSREAALRHCPSTSLPLSLWPRGKGQAEFRWSPPTPLPRGGLCALPRHKTPSPRSSWLSPAATSLRDWLSTPCYMPQFPHFWKSRLAWSVLGALCRLDNDPQRYPDVNPWNLWVLPYMTKETEDEMKDLEMNRWPWIIQWALWLQKSLPEKRSASLCLNTTCDRDLTPRNGGSRWLLCDHRFQRHWHAHWRVSLCFLIAQGWSCCAKATCLQALKGRHLSDPWAMLILGLAHFQNPAQILAENRLSEAICRINWQNESFQPEPPRSEPAISKGCVGECIWRGY